MIGSWGRVFQRSLPDWALPDVTRSAPASSFRAHASRRLEWRSLNRPGFSRGSGHPPDEIDGRRVRQELFR